MESSSELYDFSLVNEIAQGNEDFIKSLCEIFIATTPESTTQLVQAAAAKDWDNVSKLAHKLKSTVDTLNVVSLKEIIRSMETDARYGNNLDKMEVWADQVRDTLDEVSRQLSAKFL